MSRLAAAALRRGVTASRDPSSSLLAVSPPVSARLFSADASGEAAATAAESQDDSFLKASREADGKPGASRMREEEAGMKLGQWQHEDDRGVVMRTPQPVMRQGAMVLFVSLITYPPGLAYGRFYSVIGGGNRLEKNMLKTDIIHHLDRCGLSLDDVKIDYNNRYDPLAALLRFSSKAMFTTANRQTSQNRVYRIDEISREVWDLKRPFDGKTVLLQGVPRNALLEDIDRFLCGTNFEPPFESFIRAGVPEPIRMVLVKFRTKTDAMNAFITKNRGFCLNSQVSMRVLQ